MIKLFSCTVIILCLIMSAGFTGIASADDAMEKAEEMTNVSRTVEQAKDAEAAVDTEAALEEGEKIIDEAEMQKEDEELTEKHEMADETLNK